jgi:hypothetical protein
MVAVWREKEEAKHVFEEAHTTTEARILDRDFKETHDIWYYYVTIQFDADGKQMTLSASVSEELYDKAEQGKTLTTRYADANPRIVLFEGEW